jgi:CheY-like chemotaxis protein
MCLWCREASGEAADLAYRTASLLSNTLSCLLLTAVHCLVRVIETSHPIGLLSTIGYLIMGLGQVVRQPVEDGMSKIKIMLAEDHVLVREGTKEMLDREEDMEVVAEAGDGEEAVRLAEELDLDIVVMDIALPKLNGIEATKQIKENRPGTAVLVLTAYDDDEYVFALLEAGAAGYLLKDVSTDELVEAIRPLPAR